MPYTESVQQIFVEQIQNSITSEVHLKFTKNKTKQKETPEDMEVRT